jgi:hypothetical protein
MLSDVLVGRANSKTVPISSALAEMPALMETFNDKSTSDTQRRRILMFFASYGKSVFLQAFEHMDQEYCNVIWEAPPLQQMIEEIIADDNANGPPKVSSQESLDVWRKDLHRDRVETWPTESKINFIANQILAGQFDETDAAWDDVDYDPAEVAFVKAFLLADNGSMAQKLAVASTLENGEWLIAILALVGDIPDWRVALKEADPSEYSYEKAEEIAGWLLDKSLAKQTLQATLDNVEYYLTRTRFVSDKDAGTNSRDLASIKALYSNPTAWR